MLCRPRLVPLEFLERFQLVCPAHTPEQLGLEHFSGNRDAIDDHNRRLLRALFSGSPGEFGWGQVAGRREVAAKPLLRKMTYGDGGGS